jgi:hypothetical protein
MRDLRERAQLEVHEVCMKILDVRGFDRYSREDAQEEMGKNWTNICTVYLGDSEKTGNIREATSQLENLDYIANSELKDERFVIEVKLTSDVDERLASDSDS